MVKLVALVATNTGRVNVSLKSLDRRRRRGQHCRSTFELSDTGLQRLDCRNQRLVFGVGSNDSSFGLVSVGYCVTCIAERPSISFELGNGRLHCSGNCCSIKAGLGLPNCGKTVGHLNTELIELSACRIETKAGLGHLGSRLGDRAGTLRCSNERFVGRNRYALPLEIIELAGGGSGLVESFGVTLGCGEIGCGLRRCTLQRFHVRVTPISYRIESDDEFVKAIVGCLSEWSTIDIASGVVELGHPRLADSRQRSHCVRAMMLNFDIDVGDLTGELFHPSPQKLRSFLEYLSTEQLAQQLFAVLVGGNEEIGELALRQQHHALKLGAIEANEFDALF